MAKDYRESTLEGANGIQLIVALYDGLIRFLHRAADYAELGRIHEQRVVVRRSLDILMYLQARLRMDIGGRPAEVLAEFYAAMFAEIVRASRDSSREQFEHAILCVRNVRDAWREVAGRPEASLVLPRALETLSERNGARRSARPAQAEQGGWTA
jgi:flagellar protein FliS